MSQLDALLVVQEHDSAIDHLRFRLTHIAEQAEIAAHQETLSALDGDLAHSHAERDELIREEKRLDDEARSLESKAKAMEAKLYGGGNSSPRELQAMQADVDALRRSQRNVEDHELEVMERREELDAILGPQDGSRDELVSAIGVLTEKVAAIEAAIAADLAREQAERIEGATQIDADFLEIYELARLAAGGIGIARLVKGACGGCHLTIPSTEVDRLRREGHESVARCDNCGCILVAT